MTNEPPRQDAGGPPTVALTGWLRKPQTLDQATLASRPSRRAVDFPVVCTFDGAHGLPRSLEAVPLSELLLEAEPAFDRRTDFKRVIVMAESLEGYRALFSWGELFNTPVGAGVHVAWSVDAPCRPLCLISTLDHATGPRYVQGLARIELVKVW